MMQPSDQPASLPASRVIKVRFWEGFEEEVDVNDVASRSLSVKGALFENPLRFLEIYADVAGAEGPTPRWSGTAPPIDYAEVQRRFFPRLSWQAVELGTAIEQPPFCWKDADAKKLCVSFTYNANAFYRILKNLSAEGKIPERQIGNLLDKACVTLAQVYAAGNFRVIKHINNNFNMYFISKVIEDLLGPEIYCAEEQELILTSQSLAATLKLAAGFASYSTHDKMGLALGMGVAFIEQRLARQENARKTIEHADSVAHGYYGKRIALDGRARLLTMVSDAAARRAPFVLAAVLDDATETVIDLLWMQDLMMQFPHFQVNLLVNTAQISINFSRHMLETVLSSPSFQRLAALSGRQFHVTHMFCPFISFQTNYLPPQARQVIDGADLIYVKGANFFETCQLPEKPRFHAFVVYGPVSRAYSGLNDYDAVFAYVPAGRAGYVHHADAAKIITLRDVSPDRDGLS